MVPCPTQSKDFTAFCMRFAAYIYEICHAVRTYNTNKGKYRKSKSFQLFHRKNIITSFYV